MIPVLYKADATSFATFGIGTLAETMSCIVTEERNGSFECVLKYPSTGFLYKEIKKDRIIKAKPNDTKAPQAFRIYKISTPIDGIITVYAQHISYDLAAVGVMPFGLLSATPTQVMEEIARHSSQEHPFTFQSEYTEAKDFILIEPKSVRSCLGGESKSLLSRWGGEFEWDNFKMIHHISRGTDAGVVIEYGKNLTKFDHETDNSSIYTTLLPYAVKRNEDETEEVITLPEQTIPILESELLTPKTLVFDMTDKFDDEEEVTVESLRKKAKDYIKTHPLGVDTPNITIAFEPLWQHSEYAAVLERVALCDTVTIRHSMLGITTKAKVIKTVYDSLSEKYESISLGSMKESLVSKVASVETTVRETGKTVDHLPTLMQSAIKRATDKITGQTGGYVVLNSATENGQPYELLILDKPNIEEAVNVWRWNVSGLGFSHNGYNGPYETAITSAGEIVADFITSGTLMANLIKAGVISSQDGMSYWNLDTGEVVLRAYATTETVEEQASRIDEIEEQKMYRMVISSSNGNIFKNGNISTVLSAIVYSWDEDVTDQLDDNQFIWTRISADKEDDVRWNHEHFGGTKHIVITKDDVKVRATFCCDLIDTTTRKSLL